MTLEDSDRTLIVETLERVGWIVGGPRGAATKLGLKRTNLLATMSRLGIFRPIHQEETDVLALAPAGIRREDTQPLAFAKLRCEPYSQRFLQFRCFLGSQLFNGAEVKLMNQRIGFLQNMLQRINLDLVFHQ
jgi:hypothetical protein